MDATYVVVTSYFKPHLSSFTYRVYMMMALNKSNLKTFTFKYLRILSIWSFVKQIWVFQGYILSVQKQPFVCILIILSRLIFSHLFLNDCKKATWTIENFKMAFIELLLSSMKVIRIVMISEWNKTKTFFLQKLDEEKLSWGKSRKNRDKAFNQHSYYHTQCG